MESTSQRARSRTARLLHIFTVPQTLALVGAQVDYLAKRGFEIRAVSSPGPRLDEFGEHHGLTVEGVEMKRALSPVADLGAVIRLTGIIRRFRPDIVHAHTPKAGLLGTLAAAFTQTPLRIYQMRGLLSPTAEGLRGRLFDRAEKVTCRLAHHVICQSPSLHREALDRRLCPPDKCSVVGSGGNGIDATRFDPELHRSAGSKIRAELGIGSRDQVIGYVGRLVRDKGIEDLLEAWQALRSQAPESRLLLVGPLEKRDALADSLVEILDSDPRVHRVELVTNIAAYYAAMDVLVLPSYREGLPNAPLEAAAMRIPVVTTRVMGCIDAVADGETGTLVPPRSPIELAKAIGSYLASSELRAKHGVAGRQFVIERFSQRAVCEAMHVLYRRLLAQGTDFSTEARS